MYYYMAVITLFSGCQEELYYLRRSQGPKPPYWRHWEPVLYGGDERTCCWTRGPIICRFICWMLIFLLLQWIILLFLLLLFWTFCLEWLCHVNAAGTAKFFLKRKWRGC